jgi:hypothetical protein
VNEDTATTTKITIIKQHKQHTLLIKHLQKHNATKFHSPEQQHTIDTHRTMSNDRPDQDYAIVDV